MSHPPESSKNDPRYQRALEAKDRHWNSMSRSDQEMVQGLLELIDELDEYLYEWWEIAQGEDL